MRQIAHDKPVLRNRLAAKPRLAPCAKALRGLNRALDEAYRRRHGLASYGIRHAEHTGLGNGGMAFEQAVYFGGLHFEPGAIDLILDAAGDPYGSGCVDRAPIAGVKPAIVQDLVREIRPAKITRHQRRGLQHDLAIVDDHSDAAPHLADEALSNSVGFGGRSRDPVGGLGHAVTIDHLGAGPGNDLGPEPRGKRR
jgi:hypothetical protein